MNTTFGAQMLLCLAPKRFNDASWPGFNALSDRAIETAKKGGSKRSYWDWQDMLTANSSGYFPYTPATTLFYGLKEAIAMLEEEGLDNVFSRHQRLADSCRAAVDAWELETVCLNPREHSNALTGIMMPDGHDADYVRQVILEHFNMSLGTGLGKIKGKAFASDT